METVSEAQKRAIRYLIGRARASRDDPAYLSRDDYWQLERAWEGLTTRWEGTPEEQNSLIINMALAARHYQNRNGKLQDEIRWSERGLSAAQAVGNHQAIMAFYNNLGTSYHDLGDLVTALQCYVQSLPADPDSVEDSDEWARISVTLGNIGTV